MKLLRFVNLRVGPAPRSARRRLRCARRPAGWGAALLRRAARSGPPAGPGPLSCPFFEALGYDVGWDGPTHSVTAAGGGATPSTV